MLWRKESNKNGSMYVDLFALDGGLRHIRWEKADTTFNKNDALAQQKRNEGNEYFKQGQWKIAMEMYGESLCYAENGSKNISLAYANRSTCFLKMKRYSECLNDIELAKAAGYPADLLPKLDRRQAECLKGIADDAHAQSTKFESKLSFQPDEHFPSMANVLEIGVDDGGEVVVYAKEDIDVGQIIAVEKAYMKYIYSWHGSRCSICLKDETNLVPCSKCTLAMFCSKECQGNSLHQYECGLMACKCGVTNNNIMRVVRSCLLIVDIFSSGDELMMFVEKAISSDRNEIPTTLSDMKSQYEAFLKLPIGTQTTPPKDVLSIIYEAYKILLNIPKFAAMITSHKHRRFLMHLATHHYQILDLNSVVKAMKVLSPDETCDAYSDMSVKWISSQTDLISRFFAHSCAPNVHITTSRGNTIIFTVRPIKKGQQLTHTVLLQLLTQSKKERKQVLWQERKMKCKCVRCKGRSASLTQIHEISSDPDFQYISTDWSDDSNHELDMAVCVQARVNKCKSLLRKYGQYPWCEELGEIVDLYIHLIFIQQQY